MCLLHTPVLLTEDQGAGERAVCQRSRGVAALTTRSRAASQTPGGERALGADSGETQWVRRGTLVSQPQDLPCMSLSAYLKPRLFSPRDLEQPVGILLGTDVIPILAL